MILLIKLEMNFTPWPGSSVDLSHVLWGCAAALGAILLCRTVWLFKVAQCLLISTWFCYREWQGGEQDFLPASTTYPDTGQVVWVLSFLPSTFLFFFFFFLKLILAAVPWTPQFSLQPYEVLRAHMVSLEPEAIPHLSVRGPKLWILKTQP